MPLIIAGGYTATYGGDAGEIALAIDHKWFPTTIDFRETAAHSGGTGEASTFAKVIDLIAKEDAGSISDLGLVGHANNTTFSMSGRVTSDPANVVFTKEGMIHPVSIKDNLTKITALRDRFAKNGTITLYACDAGVGKDLIDSLSDAFQVCVRGFSNEIFWCFTFREKDKKIISRGKTWYDSTGLGKPPDCESFQTDIRQLSTDQKSCTGVPKQAPAAGVGSGSPPPK
jgi:hypothetical protein